MKKQTDMKFFKGEKITSETISTLDERTIERCYEIGREAVQSLVEAGDGIRNRCTVFLGWILAALASISGFLIFRMSGNDNQAISDDPLIIMAIYGVSACLVISIWLVLTTQKGFKVFGPGARPSNPIRSSVLDSLKSLSPQDKYKYILGWYLENIEFQYNANVNLIRKLMIFYRITLFAILIAIIGAIVLFLCILF